MTRRQRREARLLAARRKWAWRTLVVGMSAWVYLTLEYLQQHLTGACSVSACGVRPLPFIIAALHCIALWRMHE
jgi:hypothetical protein